MEEACPDFSRHMIWMLLGAIKTEGLIAPTGKGCRVEGVGAINQNKSKE